MAFDLSNLVNGIMVDVECCRRRFFCLFVVQRVKINLNCLTDIHTEVVSRRYYIPLANLELGEG